MISEKNGGDERYTTKAQKADRMAITKVNYLRMGSFFTSLNHGKLCLDFWFLRLCKLKMTKLKIENEKLQQT